MKKKKLTATLTAILYCINALFVSSMSLTSSAENRPEYTEPAISDNVIYGIGVSVLPDKVEYTVGEELDLTGLRLNGSITRCENGEDLTACIIDEDYFKLVENGYEISVDSSEFDHQKAGTYSIYVLFGNTKDSFEVTVIDDKAEFVTGDVTGDGVFGVSDIVALQKWILGISEATLPNWKAADLCEDGVVDVFDLCVMKRMLIGVIYEEKPKSQQMISSNFLKRQ